MNISTFEFEKLFKKNEVKQKLEKIKELGLENIIDNYLIEKKVISQEWFKKYKLEPYLKERFKYHIYE